MKKQILLLLTCLIISSSAIAQATFSTTNIGSVRPVLTNSNQTLSSIAQAGQAIAAVAGTYTTGKYYMEFVINSMGTGTNARIGIGVGLPGFNFDTVINQVYAYEYLEVPSANPYHVKQHLTSVSVWGNNVVAGDIIGVYYDLDNGFMYLSKNGSMMNDGDPSSGAAGTKALYGFPTGKAQYYFLAMVNYISSSSQITINSPATYGSGYAGYTTL
jgi:hypothetical protein